MLSLSSTVVVVAVLLVLSLAFLALPALLGRLMEVISSYVDSFGARHKRYEKRKP